MAGSKDGVLGGLKGGLVSLIPILADSDADFQVDLEVGDGGHELWEVGLESVDFMVGHFEDQFVVDLHDHFGLKVLLG